MLACTRRPCQISGFFFSVQEGATVMPYNTRAGRIDFPPKFLMSIFVKASFVEFKDAFGVGIGFSLSLRLLVY